MTTISVIPYMYRDASNYKSHGSVRLDGVLTPEQVERVRATLDLGEYFIPGQVSTQLSHLGTDLDSFPYEDDHPWHELGLDGIEEEHSNLDATMTPTGFPMMTPEALVEAFENVTREGGWDEMYYFDSLGV